MKKFWLLYLLFFYSFVQIIPQSVILEPNYPYSAVKWVEDNGNTTYSYYTNWPTKIGREDVLGGHRIFRTEYLYNISEIPENSIITRVYIRYTNTTYLIPAGTFNISHTTGTNIDQALYDEIYSSGEIVSDLNYTTSSLNIESEPMKNLIMQLLNDDEDEMFLGTFSNDESSNLSATGFINNGFQLVVEYYKPVKIWVTNNFNILGYANGGQIYIDDFTNSKTAPVHYTTGAGYNVNLKAIENQIDIDNHERDWNNNLSLNFQSEWKKYNLQNPVFIDNNKNIQYTIENIPETDENMRYEANLRKHFKMFRNKLTEFDGTQQDGIQSEIFEHNNGSITTPTDVPLNGKNYKYAGWFDNISLPQTRTITNPTDNQTYTALYKYPHHSNTGSFTNSGQRKVIKCDYGYLHLVYESMGYVWYERSTDNGASWHIMNGGKPIDKNPSKSPSIDFYYDYQRLIIVYQTWAGDNNEFAAIKAACFANGQLQFTTTVYESYLSIYSEVNYKPAVAYASNDKIAVA